MADVGPVSSLTARTAANLNDADSFYLDDGAGLDLRLTPLVLKQYLATATLAAGTITTSQPMTLTQTWNAGGVTFRGKENIYTITAAAAASTVERWLGGAAGTTVLASLSSVGGLALASGLSTTPAYGFVAQSGTGMFFSPAGSAQSGIGFIKETYFSAMITSAGFVLNGATSLSWTGNTPIDASDLFLYRDAANTLAQRNGTNAQTFRVYNTFTDASNYERGVLAWNSNRLDIGPQAAGTGTLRSIGLLSHVLFPTDNTYDIGASGATRPRSIYVGTNVTVGATVLTSNFRVGWNGTAGSQIVQSADGVLAIYNDAGTSFGRLQFGGTTDAFPSWERSAAILRARLADGSGPAVVQSNVRVVADADGAAVSADDTDTLYTNEGATAEANFTLPTAAAGLVVKAYCQDADGIKLTAATGDTIRIEGTVSATAGNIASTTVGSFVKLVAINATEWVAMAAGGTWVVT